MSALYTILSSQKISETSLEAIVKIDPEHDVFKGHFPQHPVMPGVCQLEIFTAVAGQFLERDLVLKSASNIKFLQMLDPNVCDEVKVKVDLKGKIEEGIKIWGSLFSEEYIYFKFKGVFS